MTPHRIAGHGQAGDPGPPDLTNERAATAYLTERYATGITRQAWEQDGTPLPPYVLVIAVLADTDPPRAVAEAALTLRKAMLDYAEQLDTQIVGLARRRGVSWERIGASIGVTKQAAQQRHMRRAQIPPEREQRRPASARRAWLDRNAQRLRALTRSLVIQHGSELRGTAVPVATAVYHLGAADYQGADLDVLERARDLVDAVEREIEARADAPPWDRVRLSDPCCEALDDLAGLLATAPA